MLKVVLYERSHDIYKLSFLQKELPITIVAPDPASTDAIRIKVKDQLVERKIEVFTLAKLIKEQLREIDLQLPDQYQRKEKLLMMAGMVYKKYIDKPTLEGLILAYELFTDLRSHTLNFEVLQEVLQEYDETLRRAVALFWQFFQEAPFFDEHKALAYIGSQSKKLRPKNIIFGHFTQLGGVQVDWIKALAEENDVYIPYPAKTWQERHPYDWISWLISSSTNDEIITLKKGSRIKEKASLLFYSTKKLSEALQKKLGQLLESDQKVNIFLGTRDWDFPIIHELNRPELFFKADCDLYSEIIHHFFAEIRDHFWRYDQAKKVSVDQLKEILSQKIVEVWKEENPKKLKTVMLFYKNVETFISLSQENSDIELFEWQMFKRITLLQIPRNYLIPLNSVQGYLHSLNHLMIYNQEIPNIICLDGSYQLGFPQSKMVEKALSKLSIVAPLFRKELSLSLLRTHLHELSEQSHVTFLIEKGLEEKEMDWYLLLKDIINSIQVDELKKRSDQKPKEKITLNSFQWIQEVSSSITPPIHYSPSRLQTYLDCPRKYYVSYIDKVEQEFDDPTELSNMELGQIEHLVIQKALQNEKRWDEKNFRFQIEEQIDQFLKEKGKRVSPFQLQKIFLEVFSYTVNNIQFLLKIKEFLPDTKVFAEVSIDQMREGRHFVGSIDLIFQGKWGYGVLDIKRSSSSIPKIGELLSSDSLQIGYYLHHYENPLPLRFWGYLALKEDEDDQQKQLIMGKEIGEEHPLQKIFKFKKNYMGNEWLEYQESYLTKEKELILQLEQDRIFPVRPRSASVCFYCPAKSLCPRKLV